MCTVRNSSEGENAAETALGALTFESTALCPRNAGDSFKVAAEMHFLRVRSNAHGRSVSQETQAGGEAWASVVHYSWVIGLHLKT